MSFFDIKECIISSGRSLIPITKITMSAATHLKEHSKRAVYIFVKSFIKRNYYRLKYSNGPEYRIPVSVRLYSKINTECSIDFLGILKEQISYLSQLLTLGDQSSSNFNCIPYYLLQSKYRRKRINSRRYAVYLLT